MAAMIGHCHCFCKALGFIVDAAWTDWIDMPPVIFCLWVNLWVTVDFARTCQKETSSLGQCKSKGIMCAQTTHFERLYRQLKIIYWTSRAGEMKNCIKLTFHINIISYIMFDERKIFVAGEMSDIISATGNEIIHGNHGVSFV